MKLICDCGNTLMLSQIMNHHDFDNFNIIKYDGEQISIECVECNKIVDMFVMESLNE